MSEITPVTHTEKVVAGQVDAVTHFEKVIAKYGGGGGGGGFTPTDAQLDAMNSGITSEDVEQISTNKNNISLLQAQTNNSSFTVNIDNDMTFLSTGFIKSDGSIGTASSHAVYYMTLGNIKELIFDLDSAVGSTVGLAMIKNSSGDTIKYIYLNDKSLYQTFTISNCEPTDILYVTFFNYQDNPNPYYDSFDYKDYTLITDAYKTDIEDIISQKVPSGYYNCVEKPLLLSGKKLQFFGDSITYGFISSGNRANPTYPDAFGTAVGASSTINSGVNSSTLSTVQGFPSIYDAIQNNLDTTADVLFIAGGINDWQLGVDAATLRTAMQTICTYLASNFTGKVIFITPINHGGKTPQRTPAQSLTSVREIISEIAITNGYSVVQGWQFPFPTQNSNSAYITTMYADLIHPTQVGYNTYAKALETALL